MAIIAKFLPAVQMVISALLIAAILLGQGSTGLDGALGGGDNPTGGPRQVRRGAEKKLFTATIILATLFAASAVVSFLLAR